MLVEMYPETGVIDLKQFDDICMLLTFCDDSSCHFISLYWSVNCEVSQWDGRIYDKEGQLQL